MENEEKKEKMSVKDIEKMMMKKIIIMTKKKMMMILLKLAFL